MSFFLGSGRTKRNLRPKIVHSVSDSENEDLEIEGDQHNNPIISKVNSICDFYTWTQKRLIVQV